MPNSIMECDTAGINAQAPLSNGAAVSSTLFPLFVRPNDSNPPPSLNPVVRTVPPNTSKNPDVLVATERVLNSDGSPRSESKNFTISSVTPLADELQTPSILEGPLS